MMSNELLPCPVCGGQAEMHATHDIETGEIDGWFVWCNNDRCECQPETSDHFTEAEAIAAWNTRADYHGYEQAAIESWKSIKKWNNRAERTCQNVDDHKTVWFICSVCGYQQKLSHTRSYCPNCGAKVVSE